MPNLLDRPPEEVVEDFAFALDAADVGVWTWDVTTNEVYWSDTCRRLYGFAEDVKPSYATWITCIHPDDIERVQTQTQTALLHGASMLRTEYRVRHPQKGERLIVTVGKPRFNAKGKPSRITGTAQDITDQRRIEDALRENEEILRKAHEESLIGLITLTPVRDDSGCVVDFRYSFANRAALRQLKKTKEALERYTVLELFPGHRVNGLFDRYVRVLETGVPHDIEFAIDAGGLTGWFHNVAVRVNDKLAVSFQDVTQRKLAELTSRAASEKLAGGLMISEQIRTIIDTVPVVVLIATDPSAQTIIGNKAAIDHLNLRPGGNVSLSALEDLQPSFTVYHNGASIPSEDLPVQRAARGEVVVGQELELHMNDGRILWEYGNASPLHDNEGRLCGAIGAFIDITEQKLADEAARENRLLEMLGRMSGRIAHEINNILQPIMSHASLARHYCQSNPEALEHIAEIQTGVRNGREIVGAVLALARGQTAVREPRILEREVANCLDFLKPNVPPHIALEIDLQPTGGKVALAPAELFQIINNLIVNALDAMPEKGLIQIQTRRLHVWPPASGMRSRIPQDFAQLTVTDTGSGMDEKTLARAFDPFFTTKPIGKGVGLGLSTIQALLSGLGGHIEIQSKLDFGTSVQVRFPFMR